MAGRYLKAPPPKKEVKAEYYIAELVLTYLNHPFNWLRYRWLTYRLYQRFKSKWSSEQYIDSSTEIISVNDKNKVRTIIRFKLLSTALYRYFPYTLDSNITFTYLPFEEGNNKQTELKVMTLDFTDDGNYEKQN